MLLMLRSHEKFPGFHPSKLRLQDDEERWCGCSNEAWGRELSEQRSVQFACTGSQAARGFPSHVCAEGEKRFAAGTGGGGGGLGAKEAPTATASTKASSALGKGFSQAALAGTRTARCQARPPGRQKEAADPDADMDTDQTSTLPQGPFHGNLPGLQDRCSYHIRAVPGGAGNPDEPGFLSEAVFVLLPEACG